MLNHNPFRQPGQWYRGNTHSHSTESDGKLSVTDRFAAYKDAGYDFLVLTDHRKVSDVDAHTSSDFLAISGSEVHPSNPYGGPVYHIVAINIHTPVNCAKMHPNAVLDDIKDQGGEAVLCHPYWCGHTISDYLPLRGYFAVEVYNDTCMGIGKGFSEQSWDDLLDNGGPVLGIASDDSHGTEHDCFHGWIMVKSQDLTLDNIMEALRTGAFYSTLGPEILDIDLQDKQITVKCSEAQSIVFKGDRSRGRRIVSTNGNLLTEATYSIPDSAKYVRIEVTDETGKKAWSNPFYF